jgi:hypothetical protein
VAQQLEKHTQDVGSRLQQQAKVRRGGINHASYHYPCQLITLVLCAPVANM